MSARPTRLANVPLGREIGVHRGASWRIETDSIFRSCGQPPVRHGFTLASLCRCGVPSGDFGIGVVTKGSDRPLDEALWSEIEIDKIAAYTKHKHRQSRRPIRQSGSAKLKAQEWPWADHSLRAGPPRNDRYLRKAEVQGLQKRGAQHVRIKGQAVDLSPTDASASWDRRLASGFYPVSIFFSVSSLGPILLSLLLRSVGASGWGAGRYAAITLREKAVQPPHCRIAIESSRGPLQRGERPSAAGTRNGSGRGRLHAARACLDRRFHRPAASGYLKVGPLIFTVTVSQIPVPANGDTHPSKHLRGPACSRRHL
jgi:hypothetical protein